MYICKYISPLGAITIASHSGKSLCGLWFEGQKYFGGNILCGNISEISEKSSLPVFEQTADWLDIYFGGGIPKFTPEIEITDTPFRKAVWENLLKIPYGETVTYGDIANDIGAKTLESSPRAVGSAVGRNPVSLIIPCHRVVGANGALTGYAGGIDRKEKLLLMEKTREPIV
ncbi:MAG: methylated-DNA--[protein]-cysteine S-methyltransferase [Oscillospiraceae bacterium]|nr:methylated-DNA--[protein]-cysteine S-methyltransferase [Oscillospiraceae bacterium]